jgi:hypothetical protein
MWLVAYHKEGHQKKGRFLDKNAYNKTSFIGGKNLFSDKFFDALIIYRNIYKWL